MYMCLCLIRKLAHGSSVDDQGRDSDVSVRHEEVTSLPHYTHTRIKLQTLVNPRCLCAARVTVLGLYVSVPSVCLLPRFL